MDVYDYAKWHTIRGDDGQVKQLPGWNFNTKDPSTKYFLNGHRIQESSGVMFLVGEKVNKVFIDYSGNSLFFVTDNFILQVDTWADCCSDTWFADIMDADILKKGPVTKVEYMDPLPGYDVDDGRGKQDYDLAYSFRIYVGNQFAEFIYRNSSNGYYSGSSEARIVNEIPENLECIDITNTYDWSA